MKARSESHWRRNWKMVSALSPSWPPSEEPIAPIAEERVATDQKGAGPLLDYGGKSHVEIMLGAGVEDTNLQSNGARGFV